MKRFLYILLLCALVFTFVGCNPTEEPHTHAFTVEIPSDAYLCTPAGCTEGARYYLSCTCGAYGTDTFLHGEPTGHSFTEELVQDAYLADGPTCEHGGAYYLSCACGACGTDVFTYGEAVEHSYEGGFCKWCGKLSPTVTEDPIETPIIPYG